jgi:Tfp pilus assembly protein PilE
MKFLDLVTNGIVSAIIVLMVLAPIGYVGYQRIPKPIAVVDVKALMEEEQAKWIQQLQQNSGSLTDDQRAAYNQSSMLFAQRLSSSIEQLGKECQCVLVNKAALLTSSGSGILDYTQVIRERI